MGAPMEAFQKDVRYAWRALAGSPGFTAVAIVALALGIGANTAIFSVIDAVLLRPLPFPQPERLVEIWGTDPVRKIPFHNVWYADACEWRKQCRSFESMSAVAYRSANLVLGDEPERVQSLAVNSGFFEMLGARFHLGRGFLPEEDRPGGPPAVIVTSELWKRRLGSNPGIIGTTLKLDGKSCPVIGVLAPGFSLAGRSNDLYFPLALSEARDNQGDGSTVSAFARLKPGVSLRQAQAELDAVGSRLHDFRDSLGRTPRVWGVRDFVARDLRLSLIVLFAAVVMVLLIACVNVANLLLARGYIRQKELAVRVALGATRGRLVAQLLTESGTLSLAGGVAGVVLAHWSVPLLLRVVPDRYPLLSGAMIDLRVLTFTAVLSLATGLIFGLVPALALSRENVLGGALKEGGRGSDSVARARLRSGLVVAEVALALLLLIGAALMLRSFARLTGTDPGFDYRQLLTASISLPPSKYDAPGQRVAFFRQLLEKLDSMPGVVSSGVVSALPLTGFNTGTILLAEGRPFPPPPEAPIVWFRAASIGYFRSMGVPLRSGRLFADRDENQPVAVVNETLARRFWPGENAVGKRFTNGYPRPDRPVQWATIIGVVGDLRHTRLDKEPDAELFWPYQMLAPMSLTVTIRTSQSADAAAPALRRAVAAIDRDQPVSQIVGMAELVGDSITPQRLSVTLISIFAAVALVLAAVGIFGVISFTVSRRSREVGLRMALGAQRGDVLLMVVREALVVTGIGLAIGIAGALASTRFLASLLFGVSATDPFTIAAVSVLLALVATLASYIPARRAASTDPIEALRCE
jgi:putative ABC transport system permease protein